MSRRGFVEGGRCELYSLLSVTMSGEERSQSTFDDVIPEFESIIPGHGKPEIIGVIRR
jgi:hypothetical protein